MKKLFVVVLIFVITLNTSVSAIAKPAGKNVNVELTSSSLYVKVGQTVTLTAVTPKKGSDYTDEWLGATKVETVFNQDGFYVSTAEFTARAPVTVQYKITMTAGNSGVAFDGLAAITINVSQPAQGEGVELKNIGPVPGITGFYMADVYVLLSDGSSTNYGSIYFGFAEGQTTKKLYIPVTIDGKRYMFTIDVSRP